MSNSESMREARADKDHTDWVWIKSVRLIAGPDQETEVYFPHATSASARYLMRGWRRPTYWKVRWEPLHLRCGLSHNPGTPCPEY